MKKLIQTFERSHLLAVVFIVLFCLLSFFSLLEGQASGLFASSPAWQITGYFNGILTCLGCIFLIMTLLKREEPVKKVLRRLSSIFGMWKPLTWLLVLLLIVGSLFFIFIRNTEAFSGAYFRAFTIFFTACLTAGMLKGAYRERSFNILLLFGLLALGCAYQVGNHLGEISSNPFTLEWSEGSRFYYASLVFSEKLYGQQLPLSFLHPSRYLILSIPYLVTSSSIFIHRAWQVFLWIATTGLCVLGIVKRLKLKDFWWNAVLFFSGFLFLQQAPVYYHLLIAAILVLFGFKRDKFWQSTIIVVLASCWAGISRVNWYPLPGMLAALLYILETTQSKPVKLWNYARQPLFYAVISILVSFLANLAYIPLSGNIDIRNFTTSFTSDLLWERLLPCPTFPKGILTGTLWLAAPLLLLMIFRLPAIKKSFSALQQLGLALILGVFFIGGLFVSVKIGGGSNLHNMDAFLLLLLITVYYLIFSDFYPAETIDLSKTLSILILAGLLLQPFFWALSAWTPRKNYSGESLQHDLDAIQTTVDSVNSNHPDSRILFISQRQLLTFGNVTGADLVAEHELLELMEMAISGQEDYLEQFYAELAAHDYDLIIISKQYLNFKGDDEAFPEENNAWVKNISIPVMRYYTPITWLRYTDTEIYVPRPENELQRLITQ